MHRYHVYMLASPSRALYTGVTGALEHRVCQHRRGEVSYTARHGITRLVLAEPSHSIEAAIVREKQIKGWRRRKKLALVDEANPAWVDLADGWVCTLDPPLPPPSPPRRDGSGSG